MRLLASSLLAGLMIPITALAGNGTTLATGPAPHHRHHHRSMHHHPAHHRAHRRAQHRPASASSSSSSASVTSTASTSTSSTSAGRPFIAYSADSFLKSQVTGAPVDQTLTQQFHRYMATNPEQADTDYPTIRGVDGNKWGMPYAMSDCSDPVWRIGTVSKRSPSQWESLKTTGFHAPADLGSRFTGTSDSPFVVIDRCDHITVYGHSASVAAHRRVNVASFGAFNHDSNGLDERNPASNNSQNFRSRGVIPDSMLIRKDQMDYAIAHHTDLGQVLEVFFVETDGSGSPCYTSPMVGCEQRHTGWGREGLRIAVSPSVDLSTRNCTPQALAIARTLQDYGGYLGDNSGSTTGIKAQQESPSHPVWHGTLSRDELQGCISWKDFVVVKPGWQ